MLSTQGDGPIRTPLIRAAAPEPVEPVTFDLDDRMFRCVECADVASDRAEGWRLALECDDELAAFCPECWQWEFDSSG